MADKNPDAIITKLKEPEKWTLVKEGYDGQKFWSDKDKDFTVPFEKRNDADYIFESGDAARKFINDNWNWEKRKNLPYVIMPYLFTKEDSFDGIPEPNYRLVK